MKGLRQSNKGFTLVEITVTLVLFSILATITTLSLIRWQEYSTYTNMESNAEMIYMAARNKIAQLKANNVLDEFEGWGSNYSGTDNTITGLSYNDTSKDTSAGKIYYALCKQGDYILYGSNNPNDKNKIEKTAPLLFELIVDHIADKGILNGNIAIEYGQDGTIYAVYFSDRTQMKYGNSGAGSNNAVDMSGTVNREYGKLYDNVIGGYVPQ